MRYFQNTIKDSYVLVDNDKSEQDMVHVALASDSNYARYVGVAVSSVIKNNPNRPVHFHLFFDEVFDEYTQKIRDLLSQGGDGNIHKVSIYLVDDNCFATLPSSARFTSVMYYRLLVPNVLAKLFIRRCIYIDVDVLCLSEIGVFFDMDLQGKVAAVVSDIGIHAEIEYQEQHLIQFGWDVNHLYFNSGVMLIDIEKWHDYQVEHKFFELMRLHADNLVRYPDQDALNVILQNQVKFVSDKFNWQYGWHTPDFLMHIGHMVVFAHFLGPNKPWSFAHRHPVYDVYFLSSPWGEYLPPQLEDCARSHRLYAKYLTSIGADKSLIRKYRNIYYRKKLRLLK